MPYKTRIPTVGAGVSGAILALSLGASQAQAQAYDMDCKVILCLAGGFPSNCGDAYSYMIDRITDFPDPKPPFGFCAMSDGSEYTNYRAPYSYLNRYSRAGYVCPDGANLYFDIDRDYDSRDIEAFCYTHTTTQRYRDDGEWETRTVYHGRSAAQHVNFQIQITVEPGTEVEYASPLFRLNYRTGFVTPTVTY